MTQSRVWLPVLIGIIAAAGNYVLVSQATATHELVARGFAAADVEIVRKRLDGTHWKRKLATVALLSAAAIGESYLRPVDY